MTGIWKLHSCLCVVLPGSAISRPSNANAETGKTEATSIQPTPTLRRYSRGLMPVRLRKKRLK